MKFLIMCEGTNEETLINLLLDNKKLNITRDDLIGRKPYNVRQLKNPVIKTELKHYNDVVTIYRVGDKQNDVLVIPRELKKIVSKDAIFKYCTKPEMEMLLIINEKLIGEFKKAKETPKEFAKRNIVYNGKRYEQSSEFLKEYYGGKRIENLVQNIIDYKSIKKHNKGELYLADLLE